jgi:hypothetical protein
VTLGTTKAGAFDVTVCVAASGSLWSAQGDTAFVIYGRTSGGSDIFKAAILFYNDGVNAQLPRTLVRFNSLGAGAVSEFASFHMGEVYTLRFTRDGSNNHRYEVGFGASPMALVPVISTADNTIYTPTTSGTLERIEFNTITPAGPIAGSEVNAYIDYLASV